MTFSTFKEHLISTIIYTRQLVNPDMEILGNGQGTEISSYPKYMKDEYGPKRKCSILSFNYF